MIDKLIEMLCLERGETPPQNLREQQKDDNFRSLFNIRPAGSAPGVRGVYRAFYESINS
ncbi:MAG: hypothetical protein ACI8ZB_002929 [Desulforhopalus sp.]|jgi:hypothetical protein